MDKQREKLIELIVDCENEIFKTQPYITDTSRIVALAEYLLTNGVIVPHCKVGDKVWYELYGEVECAVIYSCIGSLTSQGFVITDANSKSSDGTEVAFNGNCLGKTVFLSREEAEKALEERKDNRCSD